jgi:hypothetical protein
VLANMTVHALERFEVGLSCAEASRARGLVGTFGSVLHVTCAGFKRGELSIYRRDSLATTLNSRRQKPILDAQVLQTNTESADMSWHKTDARHV